MNELAITYLPAQISADFDELEIQASKYVSMYDNFDPEAATEDDESGIRKCRADLNAKWKELDEKRKAVKREYNKPLQEFEDRVKGVQDIINGGIARFDVALSQITDARRTARISMLDEVYQDCAPILAPLVPLSTFVTKNSKLTQKSTTDTAAVNILIDMVDELSRAQAAIGSMNIPHKADAEAELFRTLDLNAALSYAAKLDQDEQERKQAVDAVNAMKAEQEQYGNALPEVEHERITVTMTFKDVTEADINAIAEFCRNRGIHGTIKKKEA